MFDKIFFDKRWQTAALVLILSVNVYAASEERPESNPKSALDLSKIPYKIIHEKYITTKGVPNWELYMMNADGTHRVNLTKTPNIDEMYPHVSPDGTKICFIAGELVNNVKVMNVYYMNIDGSGRVKVANNATQPCWSPDGKKIAFLKTEYEHYTTEPYATLELIIYDIETGEYKLHPNKTLEHLYAICWSPDGKWFLAAVGGGMGVSDTIIAFEADGTNVYDLEAFGVRGCRPDISSDGKKLAWGETDWKLCMADIDFSGQSPKVSNIRTLFTCPENMKMYHIDFSPDGKYVAFSYGPFEGGQQVGGFAKGWNICIGDLEGNRLQITRDGNHNKEPDWVPLPPENAKAKK
jgi:Tol biopolymer transport system component